MSTFQRRITVTSLCVLFTLAAAYGLVADVQANQAQSNPAVNPLAVALGTTPSWTAEGNQDNAFFGHAVASAGDVNGDGFGDVIVGAPRYSNGESEEGRAYVYYGSQMGLSQSPGWTAEGNQAGAYFGHSVDTAGDVNGDGYDDVIVGAAFYDGGATDEGRAFVYYGSASGLSVTPAWTSESDQSDCRYGSAVSNAGDVNGDGYGDVVVGGAYCSNGQWHEGQVFLFYGSPAGLSATPGWIAETDQDEAELGWSVDTAGDINDDGYDDLITGAYFYSNGQYREGRAFVYYGSAAGPGTSANWSVESNQDYAGLGRSTRGAGDVNGDGYDDVLVGAVDYTDDEYREGTAFVYLGSPSGLNSTPQWTGYGNQSNSYYSLGLGPAGDINGDGYDDIVVGAMLYDGGQADEGGAFVYLGSATGVETTADWVFESDQPGAWLGHSIGTSGDTNGDGRSGVIIGAFLYDNGEADEGRAWVFGEEAACAPQASESDIVLIMDRSGSMSTDNKLADAKIALSTFISATNAPPDQLALVSFADTATLDQPLTTTRSAVDAAAQALVAGGNTRIDLALLEARTELTSTRHITAHARVIILLTDGQQNPAGNDPVIAQADAAKAEGATIFTIGLGPGADAALLQQIASSPAHYYFAPSSAELQDIYTQISGALTCPDIGGQVYVDKDGNNQYTPGTDTPVAGIPIDLSGTATRRVTSQADGSYLFADNFPGAYTVTVDLAGVASLYTAIPPSTYTVTLTTLNDLDNHFGLHPISKVYLPKVARNYCTGPILDDFSNAASGWPVSESSYWSYAYLNNEYRLYGKTSLTTAVVTRGDKLAGQYSVEVDVRNASSRDGSYGLVLGLNDSWTDFYTLEVYPLSGFQYAVVYHYANGDWTLVTYVWSSGIQIGYGTNHLLVQTSTASGYQAHFYVNGWYLTSINLPYASTTLRRVGLTATADDAGFDARFDNWKVVPEGCPATPLAFTQHAGDRPDLFFESQRSDP